MKVSQPVLLGVILVVLVIAALVLFNLAPSKYDEFAKCLSDKDVKMYGAFWCPHCKDQKALFGKSFQYVNYVECSTPDAQSQTDACIQAGIKIYPTWEFADGSRQSGLVSFEELSKKSGCALPS